MIIRLYYKCIKEHISNKVDKINKQRSTNIEGQIDKVNYRSDVQCHKNNLCLESKKLNMH